MPTDRCALIPTKKFASDADFRVQLLGLAEIDRAESDMTTRAALFKTAPQWPIEETQIEEAFGQHQWNNDSNKKN